MHSLYALKEDLDMLAQDITDMKKGYGTLDYIAKTIHNLELEQLFQGAQMRRIEERLDNLEKEFKGQKSRMDSMEARMDSMEARMDRMEARMDRMEARMDRMEKLLLLICKKLDINTSEA